MSLRGWMKEVTVLTSSIQNTVQKQEQHFGQQKTQNCNQLNNQLQEFRKQKVKGSDIEGEEECRPIHQ